MKKLKMKTALLAIAALLLMIAVPAQADTTLGFYNITHNNAGSAAIGEAQLFVDVEAASGGRVLFRFRNTGPAASSITDVYFDNGPFGTGSLSWMVVIDDSLSGVEFDQWASPSNLPGANQATPSFQTTWGFSADSDSPVQSNGVNPGEWLGIYFSLRSGKDFDDVLDELASGALRIGIHVQGFAGGWSESFVNTPYEPPCTDTDGDGVCDDEDGCPSDPAKTEPGACGCGVADTDSDGDGTADCHDNCPTDPNKTEPGTCGCGVADTDSDGDGTADCHDNCPTDPNKTEPGICGCGVADTDSDGDGTADCHDNCPADPDKTEPGVCGCGVADTDSDGDGTADCIDLCPADPDKTEPGVCGCGVADTDSDGDGTADCIDLCPTDPDNDADGDGICGDVDICPNDPDNDADGDGICGDVDNCPNDPDNDADGDGICGDVDNCPNAYNPDQADADGDGTGDACEPTAITLASFSAQVDAVGVTLTWETATEVDNAGFNLYRALLQDGPWTKINSALIAAQGDPVSGGSYSFLDTPDHGTFYYKLEDVDYHGMGTLHGPVKATVARPLCRPLYRPTPPNF